MWGCVSHMTARQTIDLYATLADMKDVAYKNALAVTALIELLIGKGLITREELAATAQRLDAAGE
jgi:hypothetical protein